MSESGKGRIIVKVLKVLGWTLLAIVIVLSALLFCAVKFLNSKQLSPLIERVANDYIDGHLKLGSLKLGFHPAFPILGVEIEDLSVISHAFDSLSLEQRGPLPDYADSLLTLDYMAGSLDIKRLIVDNELALHDVVMRGLGVNLVIAHNGKANYEVMKIPSDTVNSPKKQMPGFRINRFALERPKEIRFYNAADSTSASVLLLTDAAVEGDRQPTYRLRINGNVTSPKATLITNLDHISFGLNGKVYWNPARPGLVAMDEMEIRGAFLKALVTGELDLEDSPIIRKLTIELGPVALADMLTMLPDSIRSMHRLYAPFFSSDLAIGGRFELIKPMDLTTDTLPEARIRLSVPPSSLRYGKANFKEIALDASVKTMTNCPDSTIVDIESLSITAPGTHLNASASLYTPVSDPSLEANMEGDIDFADLPPIVLEKIPGFLSGVGSADLKAKGSMSMLSPERVHRLKADGSLTARNVYFLSADTSKMVEIGKAKIDFDSKRIIADLPILNAEVAVDTATVLVSGVDLAFGSVSLRAAIEADRAGRISAVVDTTRMMPIVGDLKVGRFNITSITDSAGARIRNIGGKVRLQQLSRGSKIPEILANLKIGNVSAGTLSDRILLSDTKIKASLCKMPSLSKPDRSVRKEIRSYKEYAYISPAAVYKYVYKKRHHKKRTRRVYSDTGAEDEEVLVWNLTKQFNRFLNEWKLNGSVNTSQARLLTPLFPLAIEFRQWILASTMTRSTYQKYRCKLESRMSRCPD